MNYLVAITTAVTNACTGFGSLMTAAVFQNGLLGVIRTGWERFRKGRPPTLKSPKGTEQITLQVSGPGKVQASWDKTGWRFFFESMPSKRKPKPRKAPQQPGPSAPEN
jgi:hypothetical protein